MADQSELPFLRLPAHPHALCLTMLASSRLLRTAVNLVAPRLSEAAVYYHGIWPTCTLI